jgi:DNA-binding NarL/FixJ family response regulator
MALRAVLADQQKMFTEGVNALLKEMNCSIIKVGGMVHNQEDLFQMLSFPVDILIVELTLGGKLDSSLVSELKKKHPNVKVIILSMYGEPHIVREAFINGADGYVSKTNHILELIQCIDFVADGKTYIGDGLRLSPAYEKSKKSAVGDKKIIVQDKYLLKQKLTKREKEILSHIVQFKDNKTIAQELYISDQTVSVHRKRIMKKFGVNTTVSLIKFSMDHQLV